MPIGHCTLTPGVPDTQGRRAWHTLKSFYGTGELTGPTERVPPRERHTRPTHQTRPAHPGTHILGPARVESSLAVPQTLDTHTHTHTCQSSEQSHLPTPGCKRCLLVPYVHEHQSWPCAYPIYTLIHAYHSPIIKTVSLTHLYTHKHTHCHTVAVIYIHHTASVSPREILCFFFSNSHRILNLERHSATQRLSHLQEYARSSSLESLCHAACFYLISPAFSDTRVHGHRPCKKSCPSIHTHTCTLTPPTQTDSQTASHYSQCHPECLSHTLIPTPPRVSFSSPRCPPPNRLRHRQ